VVELGEKNKHIKYNKNTKPTVNQRFKRAYIFLQRMHSDPVRIQT
jgi:hypothetical protein